MGKIFDATPEKLRFLLESIHNKEMALPDFQRDFVWEPGATEELIESICQSFPAGSLLRIRNAGRFYFAPREFAGAVALNGHKPSYLVLDGQQRLTSLYQAFYGAGAHQYFISLRTILDGGDLEDAVFFLKNRDSQKYYGTLRQQAGNLIFPLKLLFGDPGGFEEWLDKVLELRQENDDDKKILKSKLREAQKLCLRPIDDYEFPVVTLAEETGAAAVCTIFETLNRTGVKLSPFDLLTARFWPADVKLRELWAKAKDDHPIIAEYNVDPYYILQAISLSTYKTASCKRGDVLKMEVGQIKRGWEPIVKGLADALRLLRDDCGVVIPKWLPYTTILVPAAAIMAHIDTLNGPDKGAARHKVLRWFWCSVFGQAYDNAANSQSAKDFGDLKAWIAGKNPPDNVTNFGFDYASLRTTTPRQRAIYSGVIAVILRNGSRDFHNHAKMTAALIASQSIDDHHIFPDNYLKTNRADVTETSRGCVLNRTLIDETTNKSIGQRAPSQYLADISRATGEKKLDQLLESHLLPNGKDSPLMNDDFDSFLDQRQALMEKHIKEVTS